LKNRRVHSLAVSGACLLAGTDGGLFKSIDNGESWSEFNGGLADIRISSLAMGDSDLFAATQSAGVWRRPLSELALAVLPRDRYPGGQPGIRAPGLMRAGDRIEFFLDGRAPVELSLYDAVGRKERWLAKPVVIQK